MIIRPFQSLDHGEVLALWQCCALVVPQNDPSKDIARKMRQDPEGFLIGAVDGRVIGTIMGGYDGHRGWINYLAVHPNYRSAGIGKRLVHAVELRLRQLGCPKINLQVRSTNAQVVAFYQAVGFAQEPVISMGKRLEQDA